MSDIVQFKDLNLIQDEVLNLFEVLKSQMISLLPFAEVEHIGSTSVPGSITKGDLDIAVAVNVRDFDRAKSILESFTKTNEHSHSDHQYQPYIWFVNEQEVGVQLFCSGSIYDKRFLAWRDALIQSNELLSQYNALKLEYNGRQMSEYRDAKSNFIRTFLQGVPNV